MTTDAAAGSMASDAALAALWRDERGVVLATLVREARGDFDAAEDALADAVARAAECWPRDGVPERPAAWVLVTARRRLVDAARARERRARLDWSWGAQQAASTTGPDDEPHAASPTASAVRARPAPFETSGTAAACGDDPRLALLFACCHPALNDTAQVALALNVVGGLTAREIARAHLEAEAAAAQRLVRAKRKIRAAGIAVTVPPPGELRAARIPVVQRTIYLLFNEGYAATEGETYIREPLCAEAIRLARLLTALEPDDGDGLALLALLLAHHARRTTRLDADGALVLLEDQDRGHWDRSLIREAVQLIERAVRTGPLGALGMQARIALLHAQAPTAAATPWLEIAECYGVLRFLQPSPVVELNAAVAMAMARGPEWGLQQLDAIAGQPGMADYHLLPAARADLLRRAGRFAEALPWYARAQAAARTVAEQRYLARRVTECAAATG